MKSGSMIRLAGLLGACAIASGCGSAFRTPYPAKAYFLLDPGHPADRAAAVARSAATPAAATLAADDPPGAGRQDTVLKVRQIRVSPPYDGTAFVYKIGPNQYSSDYYSAFLMPSDTMLSVDVRDWLARSGLFTHVVDAGSSVRAHDSLEGNLTGFYADFTDRRAPRAVVEVQFSLLSDGDAGPQIIFSQTYFTSAPVTGAGPAGIVDAWNRACRTMLEELTANLERKALAVREVTKSGPGQGRHD